MLIRRLTTVAAAASATVALTMGSAAAHFCYVENAHEKGQQGRANSTSWVPFHVMAASRFPGLCPAGIDVLAAATGITADTAIFQPRTLPSSSGIGHLDFRALGGATSAAFEACAAE